MKVRTWWLETIPIELIAPVQIRTKKIELISRSLDDRFDVRHVQLPPSSHNTLHTTKTKPIANYRNTFPHESNEITEIPLCNLSFILRADQILIQKGGKEYFLEIFLNFLY